VNRQLEVIGQKSLKRALAAFPCRSPVCLGFNVISLRAQPARCSYDLVVMHAICDFDQLLRRLVRRGHRAKIQNVTCMNAKLGGLDRNLLVQGRSCGYIVALRLSMAQRCAYREPYERSNSNYESSKALRRDISGPPIMGGSQDAAEPEVYESDIPAKGCSILLQIGRLPVAGAEGGVLNGVLGYDCAATIMNIAIRP
jgi:hypothetical protein